MNEHHWTMDDDMDRGMVVSCIHEGCDAEYVMDVDAEPTTACAQPCWSYERRA